MGASREGPEVPAPCLRRQHVHVAQVWDPGGLIYAQTYHCPHGVTKHP